MKINKRECRKYSLRQIRISPNHGLLYSPSVRYVARAAVRNISRKRLLIIYMYPVKEILSGKYTPKFAVFQGKDEFITLEYCEDGKSKWRRGSTAWLDSHSYMASICAFYSREDERKVIRFCNPGAETAFAALSTLQDTIRWKESEKRSRRKKKEVAALMRPVNARPLPKGLQSWIEREVFPAHIFYRYRKGKQVQAGYCTRCKTAVSVESPRHGKKGVCPNCHSAVTFHAAGRTKRVYEAVTTQVVQHVDDALVVRICKANALFEDQKEPIIHVWENARMFFRVSDGEFSMREFYYSYGNDAITNWRKGSRPTWSRWCYYFEADTCGHVFTGNLDKELRGTPWQYCQLKAYYLSDHEAMSIAPYLKRYYQYPALEYLVKLKLYRLATDAVYGDRGANYYYREPLNLTGRSIREVLGVGKAYLPMLQELNVNVHALKVLQNLLAAGMKADSGLLRWCQENRITNADSLIRCLRHMTAQKMMYYLSEQAASITQSLGRPNSLSYAFELYCDYIRFCEELKYDLTDDFICYPRNIKDAHDRASEMFDRNKVKRFNETIAAEYAALTEQYQMTKGGLTIVPPKNAEEIVVEGQKLHHCVGSYVSRVAKKECVILFLRSEEAPDTPFYTIEVKDGKVAQIRGNQNCIPTPEVNAYMKVWEQEKLRSAA